MLTRRMKKLKEEEAIRREEEAMQRVFEIPMVVEEIIDKLKLKDLKRCRLVCSMWKETATKVILKKDSSQVCIVYDKKMRKFRKNPSRRVQQKYHLTKLTNIVEKSNPFPCSVFCVNGGNLGDPEIVDFFKARGDGIKTLYLFSMVGTSSGLLDHCPNVENLFLNLHGWENNTMMQIEFPKLKLFAAAKFSRIRFRNIIAPNLKVFEQFNLAKDTTDVVKTGKVHTIKDLCLDKSSRPEKLQEFLSAGPQIEELTFYNHHEMVDENWRRDFAGPLQKLLNTSKDTLKVLEFSGLGHLFEDLKFPRFSQLTRINFGWSPGPHRHFPIRTNLPEKFPTLEVLTVYSFSLTDNSCWDKYFPPPDAYIGQLTSVTRVLLHFNYYRGNCAQKCREMFQLMCPNAVIIDN